MIPTSATPAGLLWFDDDARRPIQQKIAEAAQRYRERVGYEPTVCQLNPAQASALEKGAATAAKARRGKDAARAAAIAVSLRLVPSDSIQPHCFLITIGADERPKRAVLKPLTLDAPPIPRARRASTAAAARADTAAIAVDAEPKVRRARTDARRGARTSEQVRAAPKEQAAPQQAAPRRSRKTAQPVAEPLSKRAATTAPKTPEKSVVESRRAAKGVTKGVTKDVTKSTPKQVASVGRAEPEPGKPARQRTTRTPAVGTANVAPTPKTAPSKTGTPGRPKARTASASSAAAPLTAPHATPKTRRPRAEKPAVLQPTLPLLGEAHPRKRSA